MYITIIIWNETVDLHLLQVFNRLDSFLLLFLLLFLHVSVLACCIITAPTSLFENILNQSLVAIDSVKQVLVVNELIVSMRNVNCTWTV